MAPPDPSGGRCGTFRRMVPQVSELSPKCSICIPHLGIRFPHLLFPRPPLSSPGWRESRCGTPCPIPSASGATHRAVLRPGVGPAAAALHVTPGGRHLVLVPRAQWLGSCRGRGGGVSGVSWLPHPPAQPWPLGSAAVCSAGGCSREQKGSVWVWSRLSVGPSFPAPLSAPLLLRGFPG